MKYKAIFFDWGGVIANDPGDEFLSQLLSQIGATENQKFEIFRTYMSDFMKGVISEKEYWQSLRDNYGLVIKDSISEEFNRWNGLVANQEILELVKNVHNLGLKTAVLSNVIKPTFNVIEHTGYYDQFDDVIASCEVAYAKPQPEIYQLALEKLGVTAKESIFIDDKQSCLDPAAAMGFATILAKNPKQIIADVNALLT